MSNSWLKYILQYVSNSQLKYIFQDVSRNCYNPHHYVQSLPCLVCIGLFACMSIAGLCCTIMLLSDIAVQTCPSSMLNDASWLSTSQARLYVYAWHIFLYSVHMTHILLCRLQGQHLLLFSSLCFSLFPPKQLQVCYSTPLLSPSLSIFLLGQDTLSSCN